MFETYDGREVTSRHHTLEDAISSAADAWIVCKDERSFSITHPSGHAVALVERGVTTLV